MDIAQPHPVYFTTSQLQKLHRQFVHPSADKLYKLLKKARPKETDPNTLEILEDLTRRCDACQRVQTAPVRFRVSIGAEDLQFNEEIYMDIMYIDHKPILHIVDAATRFSADLFFGELQYQRSLGNFR